MSHVSSRSGSAAQMRLWDLPRRAAGRVVSTGFAPHPRGGESGELPRARARSPRACARNAARSGDRLARSQRGWAALTTSHRSKNEPAPTTVLPLSARSHLPRPPDSHRADLRSVWTREPADQQVLLGMPAPLRRAGAPGGGGSPEPRRPELPRERVGPGFPRPTLAH